MLKNNNEIIEKEINMHKEDKEFNIKNSTEIISKNNNLKNLYFIGFNSKPVNKSIINSMNFTDAVNSIKTYLDNEELTVKCCGSLILGLCKVYEKKIKLYYEDLENLLKLNKDKKNQNKENTNIEKEEKKTYNTEDTKSKRNIGKNRGENIDKNKDYLKSDNNLSSKSIKDFDIRENNNKNLLNFYDLSSFNAENSSLKKFNFKNSDNTPSKLTNFFNKENESSSNIDNLRANNSNLIESNSRILNSDNKFLQGLVDKSNLDDEIFNRNFNNFFQIVSEKNINFNTIENEYPANEVVNYDYNVNEIINIQGKKDDYFPRKLIFSELKSKMEIDLENSVNFQNNFDIPFQNKTKKSKRQILKADKKIYLNIDIEEILLSKNINNKVKSKKKDDELNIRCPENIELLGKFQNDINFEKIKTIIQKNLLEISNEWKNFEIMDQLETGNNNQIISYLNKFFSYENNNTDIIEKINQDILYDDNQIFNNDLIEKLDNLLKDEFNISKTTEQQIEEKDPQEDDIQENNENDNSQDDSIELIDENIDHNNIENDQENSVNDENKNLDDENDEDNNLDDSDLEDVNNEEIQENIDNDILNFLIKKNNKDTNFKEINKDLSYDPANIFYRLLSLAQKDKIEINQVNLFENDKILLNINK